MSEHFQGVATKLKKKKNAFNLFFFSVGLKWASKIAKFPTEVCLRPPSVIFNAYLRLFISTSCLWVLWASSHKLAVRFSAKHVDREFFGDVISPDAVKFSPV